MIKDVTIEKTVEAKLCNTCGACYACCPENAIAFQETIAGHLFPQVNEQTCIQCGLCLNVCPGDHFSSSLKQAMPEDPFEGNCIQAFLGKTSDEDLYGNSQSGGLASSLLAFALNSGRIKTAAIVEMEQGTPPRPNVRLIDNAKELFASQKSKYCPVPLLRFLKDLKEADKPVGLVALSCQVHGLNNMMDEFPQLKDKIAFVIGLVCDRVMTYAAIDHLAGEFSNKGTYNIAFRDKTVSDYPGDVHLFNNRASKIKPAKDRMQIKDYYTPVRCRLCFDKMNVFSDITLGDPNGIQGIEKGNGKSVAIVRTTKGKELMDAAIDEHTLLLEPLRHQQILNGQKINRKKQDWQAFSAAWNAMDKRLPDYGPGKLMPDIKAGQPHLNWMKHAESLDDYDSRRALLEHVKKEVKKLRRKRRIKSVFKRLKLS